MILLQKLFNLRRTIILKPLNYLIFLIFLILLFKTTTFNNNKFEIKVKNLPNSISSFTSSSSFTFTGNNNNNNIKCSLNELSQGKWIKKPRLEPEEEEEEGSTTTTNSNSKIRKVSDFLLGTERINMLECEGKEERLLKINDYIFESNFKQCNRLEFNQLNVVKRLLTMPEGLIIVGGKLFLIF